MNKKILLSILVMIIIAGLGVIVYFFLILRCPKSCDDGNSCTQDICSKETNYKCFYTKLEGPQLGCLAKVTCGKELCKTGVCQTDYVSDCCGNNICEIKEPRETYETCPADCPNCDDDNKCTKDSYDYHQQECFNKIIIPCCGNKICDEGAEKFSNCPADCQHCNDNNKLTADSFNYKTQKCENVVTHHFFDDFEEGTTNWEFTDERGNPTAWSTTMEGSNTVLRATGYWGNLRQKAWTDYIFKVKFKITQGNIQFNYRIGEKGMRANRYMIGVSSDYLSLTKSIGQNFYNLVGFQNLNLGKGWHTFEIRGYGNILNIFVDNKLLIKNKDTESPILSGEIALEVPDEAEVFIDDVEIKVITEKDIIHP